MVGTKVKKVSSTLVCLIDMCFACMVLKEKYMFFLSFHPKQSGNETSMQGVTGSESEKKKNEALN